LEIVKLVVYMSIVFKSMYVHIHAFGKLNLYLFILVNITCN